MIDKEIQQQQRQKIIGECVELSKEHKHLVIELPTGTGKGLAVAECIRASESDKPWIVLVPEIAQIDNYTEDLRKHNNGDLILAGIIEDIICYASVDKIAGRSVNIHLNEAHRVSEHRMDVMKTVQFDQVISDSATINRKVEERLLEIYPFYKYSKDLQEVIDLGILPQPEIVCMGITLSPIEQKEYDKLSASVEYWKNKYEREGGRWNELKWLSGGAKRKRWLSARKTSVAKGIIAAMELKGERYVCYCGTVAQAKELGGKHAIHGKNKNNQEIIDQFNAMETNKLFSCQMVIEGMNFTEVNNGLLIQLDGTDRTFIQKTGRILRGDSPTIYIVYVKNTRDQTYLNNALGTLDTDHIKFVDL
jgi:superfamily II DNA or RNA helicase